LLVDEATFGIAACNVGLLLLSLVNWQWEEVGLNGKKWGEVE
jgi:hypothetical protein